MNPRTGRPPKPPEERRSVSRELRFTPAENELMRQAGGSNWSEWARDVLLRAAKRKR